MVEPSEKLRRLGVKPFPGYKDPQTQVQYIRDIYNIDSDKELIDLSYSDDYTYSILNLSGDYTGPFEVEMPNADSNITIVFQTLNAKNESFRFYSYDRGGFGINGGSDFYLSVAPDIIKFLYDPEYAGGTWWVVG